MIIAWVEKNEIIEYIRGVICNIFKDGVFLGCCDRSGVHFHLSIVIDVLYISNVISAISN